MMESPITQEEKKLVRDCMDIAAGNGASAIRASLEKSVQNTLCVLDGNVDRVAYSADRNLYLDIFAKGKYGFFSTNRLTGKELETFIRKAVDTVTLLSPDPCRQLPDPGRKATGCSGGYEMELADPEFSTDDVVDEVYAILGKGNQHRDGGLEVISTESEYSKSLDSEYLVDSDGFEGTSIETSASFSTEASVMDRNGNKYSGFWWDASIRKEFIRAEDIYERAIENACRKVNPGPVSGGKRTIVVDSSCASRLVSPILDALDGSSIQQHNSFLDGALGKKIFSEHLTIIDDGNAKGCMGSRLFDGEGVSVKTRQVIENGVVKMYFVNDYISRKTGLDATVGSVSRPVISPYICNSGAKEIPLKDISCNDILKLCDKGLYVTSFNGGNCNCASGGFSFGIEGFLFERGEIVHPFREVLVTGNIIDLWSKLIACGSDPRRCSKWQIPTLAFEGIDINA